MCCEVGLSRDGSIVLCVVHKVGLLSRVGYEVGYEIVYTLYGVVG